MARPTDYPEWASSGVNITEPSEPKKDAGWVDGERPPAHWMNWLFNNIYLWIVQFVLELDALVLLIGTEISDRMGAITTEQGVRSNADAALQSDIDAVAGNLATETSNRSGADSALANRLDEYDGDTAETSGIMHLYGFSADQNVNFYAQFIRHRAETQMLTEVVLWLPNTVATSNTQYLGFTDAYIPANLRPDVAQSIPVAVYENGSTEPIAGMLRLTTTGDWQIRQFDGANFTSSNTKGIGGQVIRYRKALESI